MHFSNRDLAAIAGGMAAGIIGSRMFAPVLAAGRGSLNVRMGEDPFELLIQDHRDFLSTLQEMEQTGPGHMGSRSKQFLKLKRGLGKHSLAEEDIVYPLLGEMVDGGKEIRDLYNEHADIKIRLFELEQLLKADAEWTWQVRGLLDLIDRHAKEEEEVQFPKLRRAMDEQRLRSLSSQIHREEAMML
jgi:hemerythrin superfamily protein